MTGYPQLSSGRWFGTFFVFPYIGNNHPNWLSIFLKRGWNHQPGNISTSPKPTSPSLAGPHAETGVAARVGPGSYETTPGSTVVVFFATGDDLYTDDVTFATSCHLSTVLVGGFCSVFNWGTPNNGLIFDVENGGSPHFRKPHETSMYRHGMHLNKWGGLAWFVQSHGFSMIYPSTTEGFSMICPTGMRFLTWNDPPQIGIPCAMFRQVDTGWSSTVWHDSWQTKRVSFKWYAATMKNWVAYMFSPSKGWDSRSKKYINIFQHADQIGERNNGNRQ